jgi:hypothetical protein
LTDTPRKTVQERIASFPAAVLVDLEGLACETRYGIVAPGEQGYQPLYLNPSLTMEEVEEIMCKVRKVRAATVQEREAAMIGSLAGWDVPGADPERYDETGRYVG